MRCVHYISLSHELYQCPSVTSPTHYNGLKPWTKMKLPSSGPTMSGVLLEQREVTTTKNMKTKPKQAKYKGDSRAIAKYLGRTAKLPGYVRTCLRGSLNNTVSIKMYTGNIPFWIADPSSGVWESLVSRNSKFPSTPPPTHPHLTFRTQDPVTDKQAVLSFHFPQAVSKVHFHKPIFF